jgi:hypothetical protein
MRAAVGLTATLSTLPRESPCIAGMPRKVKWPRVAENALMDTAVREKARNETPAHRRFPTTLHLEVLWFAGLAVAVLGPLLLPGYLLLLDAPAGPSTDPPSYLPLPSQGHVSAPAPVLTLPYLVGKLHPQIPNKLLIAAIVVIAGIGMYRFLTRRLALAPWPALGGATLFVINPFVYDRMVAGQLVFLLAYAAMPWALPSLTNLALRGTRRTLLTAAAWAAGITVVDVHIGGMVILLTVLALVFSPAAPSAKAMLVLVTVAIVAAVNLYWLLPSLLAGEGARLGSGDFLAYAPRPRSARILPHVLALHGFWRLEFPTPLSLDRVRFLASFIPLVVAAGYGVIRALDSAAWRRAAATLGTAFLVAIVLAMGRSFPPTEPMARLLFERVPGYGIYREPQKWVAVLSLSYAVFAAVGFDSVARVLERRKRVLRHVVAVAVVLPLVATSVMLWGFGGRVHNSQFPDDWTRAEELIKGRPGNVMAMPWNLYQPTSFAGERTIANPSPHFFSLPTLISDDAQLYVRDDTPPPDPRDEYVRAVVNRRGEIRYFGHLVAPLGVRYVVLANIADYRTYQWLHRQDDLMPLHTGEELTLFENEAWPGSTYGLEDGDENTSLTDILTSAEGQRLAAEQLVESDIDAATSPLPGPGVMEAAPGWDRVQPRDTPITGTDKSCVDGWRLGSEEAVCHLGGVAAFSNPGTEVNLWRPGVFVQLSAYVLSVIAGVVLWRLIARERHSA